jgi:hypothetical protein
MGKDEVEQPPLYNYQEQAAGAKPYDGTFDGAARMISEATGHPWADDKTGSSAPQTSLLDSLVKTADPKAIADKLQDLHDNPGSPAAEYKKYLASLQRCTGAQTVDEHSACLDAAAAAYEKILKKFADGAAAARVEAAQEAFQKYVTDALNKFEDLADQGARCSGSCRL